MAVSVVGSLLVVAGLVMLVTPGPGLLAIIAGLAVWAREFRWARRMLDRARQRVAERLGRGDTTVGALPTEDHDGDAPDHQRVA